MYTQIIINMSCLQHITWVFVVCIFHGLKNHHFLKPGIWSQATWKHIELSTLRSCRWWLRPESLKIFGKAVEILWVVEIRDTSLMATRNPAKTPADMVNIPKNTGFYIHPRWLFWDFWTIDSQYGQNGKNMEEGSLTKTKSRSILWVKWC